MERSVPAGNPTGGYRWASRHRGQEPVTENVTPSIAHSRGRRPEISLSRCRSSSVSSSSAIRPQRWQIRCPWGVSGDSVERATPGGTLPGTTGFGDRPRWGSVERSGEGAAGLRAGERLLARRVAAVGILGAADVLRVFDGAAVIGPEDRWCRDHHPASKCSGRLACRMAPAAGGPRPARLTIVLADWCPHCVPLSEEKTRELGARLGVPVRRLDIDEPAQEREADALVQAHGDWSPDYLIPQVFLEWTDGRIEHILTGFPEGVSRTRRAWEDLFHSEWLRRLMPAARA